MQVQQIHCVPEASIILLHSSTAGMHKVCSTSTLLRPGRYVCKRTASSIKNNSSHTYSNSKASLPTIEDCSRGVKLARHGFPGSAGTFDCLLCGADLLRSGQVIDKDALRRCPLLSPDHWTALFTSVMVSAWHFYASLSHVVNQRHLSPSTLAG